MRLLTLSAIILTPALIANADVDTIIPMPKEVHAVGDPVPLAGFRIVANASERAHIGAAEINERVRALGGRALPVLELTEPLPGGKLIVLAPCSALPAERYGITRVTKSDPGPQGYVVKPVGDGDQSKLFLVGSDPLGTLYAAVTCRQLIVKRDGTLMLQPAAIRDWPDYRYRQNGAAFAESLRGNWYGILSEERKGNADKAKALAAGFVARQKRYFDWMLRAKINLAGHSTNIRPGDAPEGTNAARTALKEIHEYGLARGIESMCNDTTAIGRHPRDKDNPDFKDIVLHRAHNRYFCWSRLDDHHGRAERAAKWLADGGYTCYYLHATDGGGWRNPELWDNRCPRCRETYGDDRAAADWAVFGIYYRAIKRRIPNLKFVAVIYPYNGRWLDPDHVYAEASKTMGAGEATRQVVRRACEKQTRFLQRLNALMPKDIFVCIREAERPHIARARAAWGNRPFQLYYEYAYWKGWRPHFITTPLWTKTLYYPAYDDILFGNVSGDGWRELTELLGAECAWNVNRPGAGELDTTRWREIGTAVPPPPERKAFAKRACRFWFGDEAGSLMAPVFAENISHTFIAKPDEVMQHLDIDDPAQTMSEQAQATTRAAESLDRLWDLQQKSPVLTGDTYGYFLNFYLMTHGARVLAAHRAHMLSAKKAIAKGNRSAVEEHLKAARDHLAQAAPRWSEIRKKVPRDKLFCTYLRERAVSGMISRVNVSELQQEVHDLWDRREQIIAASTIPKWFTRDCRHREIVAVPVVGSIKVDGRLDEPAWQDAWPIEHFVDYRSLRLEALETQAKLLYRPGTLYVAFDCFDPDPEEISLTMAARDEHRRCDSVEVLVAPPGQSKEFVHWIVDSKGTVFDACAAKAPHNRAAYSSNWNGSANVAALRHADRWTVEMAIPAADLGIQPVAGGTCRALLGRNIVHTRPQGEEESNAIVFLEGSGFHTVDRFARLRFGKAGEHKPAPQVALTLRPMTFKHVTTGGGSGTTVGGALAIETDTSLHDVHVTAGFTDGVDPLGRKEVGTAGLVRLMWRPEKPFFALLPMEFPGVVCTFTMTCREGRWSFVRRFGSPRRAPVPPEQLYADGIDGQALAMPAFVRSFDPATIQLSEGTIEFWVKPRWDAVPRKTGPGSSLEHTFFNQGPIRPDYPYLSNYNCLTLSHSTDGNLGCTIANSNYEARHVRAGIRDWRKGKWHHVALQWKLDAGGKTAMALFIDGRLASDRCTGSAKHPNTQPLKMKPLLLPIQIGSMNTGYRPADALIDELRISSVRRYSGSFTPRKRLEPDPQTMALFHFDGRLIAAIPHGLSASAGPAQ